MRRASVALATAAALLFAGELLAQEEGADASAVRPIEIFVCSFRDGRTMADLDRVIAGWNQWMDKADTSGYEAFLLTPDFFSGDSIDWDVGWVGVWPDGKAMGRSLDIWHQQGGEHQKAFFEVISCSAHSGYASSQLKAPKSDPTVPIVSFSNCSLKEGAKWEDLMSAIKDWMAWEDEKGSEAAHWLWYPAYGESPDADYDFKWVTANPSYTSFGADWESYGNGGGWQKGEELFADKLDCDSSRIYRVRAVRTEPNE